MEQKSLEDWVLEKQFKSVPNIVDVSSFGGITREYQVRLDPEKLVSYGLNLSQVEQQLANNNTNAGGSFIEAGLQQVNVRSIGLFGHTDDIRTDGGKESERHGHPDSRYRHRAARPQDSPGTNWARDSSGGRGESSTTMT